MTLITVYDEKKDSSEAIIFEYYEGDITEEALFRLSKATVRAVDTETRGLNPHRDRLCLVQIADSANNLVVVKIRKEDSYAENLKQLLQEGDCLNVMHYARFDMAFLQTMNIEVANPYCTKIASKLARTYAPKHGLKDVVAELVGTDLDKGQQCSDWGADTLTYAQLLYALNDVITLLPAYQKLADMLTRESLDDLAMECMSFLPTQVQLDLRGYTGIFEH